MSPVLSVDGLIIEDRKIILLKRAIYPFKDFWVLPGGKVKYGETVEQAIVREIKEELGIKIRIKRLLGVYSNPSRDPRYHSVSIAYVLKRISGKIKLNFEASQFKYFSLNKLPKKIGFDHRKIINDFKKLTNYEN